MKERKLKKEFEIRVEDTEYPAMGIGYYESKKMLIKNTFPEQVYWGRYMKNHNGAGVILPLEKLQRAPYEVEPECVHYGKCGGCMSQDIPYDRQTGFKEKEVLQLFADADLQFDEYHGIIGSPNQYRYRNKMEYTFGDEVKGGEMTLGMHLKGRKNAVVTTDGCKLVSEDFNRIVKACLEYFKAKNVPYYRTMSHKGILRNLIIREGKNTGELLVILVTADFPEFQKSEWVELLLNLKTDARIQSIFHCTNNSLQDAVIPEQVELLHGAEFITEKLLNLTFKITPFSFFQTNTEACEALYQTVKTLAGDLSGKEVFDLYCGTGTIGNIIAGGAKHVTGIELIEEAAEIARENSVVNGITNTEFIAGDVKEVITGIEKQPDLIIIDPPRAGLHPKALEYTLQFKPKEMIYVSCNPKTLAADLKKIGAEMHLVSLTILDNYPNTNHTECLVLMSKPDK